MTDQRPEKELARALSELEAAVSAPESPPEVHRSRRRTVWRPVAVTFVAAVVVGVLITGTIGVLRRDPRVGGPVATPTDQLVPPPTADELKVALLAEHEVPAEWIDRTPPEMPGPFDVEGRCVPPAGEPVAQAYRFLGNVDDSAAAGVAHGLMAYERDTAGVFEALVAGLRSCIADLRDIASPNLGDATFAYGATNSESGMAGRAVLVRRENVISFVGVYGTVEDELDYYARVADEKLATMLAGRAATRAAIAECNDPRAVDADPGNWTIEDAQSFEEFPIFWIGDSWDGCQLTSIIRYVYDPPDRPGVPDFPQNEVTFIYGSCVIEGVGFDRGGCAPPFVVNIYPYCQTPPELVAGLGIEPATTMRGALGQWLGDSIMLWTQNVAIRLWSADRGTADRMLDALQPVNAAASLTPDGLLHPPDPITCPPLPPGAHPATQEPNETPPS